MSLASRHCRPLGRAGSPAGCSSSADFVAAKPVKSHRRVSVACPSARLAEAPASTKPVMEEQPSTSAAMASPSRGSKVATSGMIGGSLAQGPRVTAYSGQTTVLTSALIAQATDKSMEEVRGWGKRAREGEEGGGGVLMLAGRVGTVHLLSRLIGAGNPR